MRGITTLCLAFLLLLPSPSFAQTSITWSEEVRLYKKDVLGFVEEGGELFRLDNPNYPKEHHLQVSKANNLGQIKEGGLLIQPKAISVGSQELVRLGEDYFMVYLGYTSLTNREMVYFPVKDIKTTGVEIGKKEYKSQARTISTKRDVYRYATSKNNKYFGAISFDQSKNSSSTIVESKVYGEGFKLLWSGRSKVSPSPEYRDLESMNITDEGDIFLVYSKTDVDEHKTVHVVKIPKKGAASTINLDGIINEPIFGCKSFLKSDGNLLISGMCGTDGRKAYSVILDQELTELNSSVANISETLPDRPVTAKNRKTDKGFVIDFDHTKMTLQKIIESKDGSTYLLSSFFNSNGDGPLTSQRFDIYVFRFSPTGEVDWVSRVSRNYLMYGAPVTPLYFASCNAEGISVYYNDDPEVKSIAPEVRYMPSKIAKKLAVNKVTFNTVGERTFEQIDNGSRNEGGKIYWELCYPLSEQEDLVGTSSGKSIIFLNSKSG